jgi:hypothetical protein
MTGGCFYFQGPEAWGYIDDTLENPVKNYKPDAVFFKKEVFPVVL